MAPQYLQSAGVSAVRGMTVAWALRNQSPLMAPPSSCSCVPYSATMIGLAEPTCWWLASSVRAHCMNWS